MSVGVGVSAAGVSAVVGAGTSAPGAGLAPPRGLATAGFVHVGATPPIGFAGAAGASAVGVTAGSVGDSVAAGVSPNGFKLSIVVESEGVGVAVAVVSVVVVSAAAGSPRGLAPAGASVEGVGG